MHISSCWLHCPQLWYTLYHNAFYVYKTSWWGESTHPWWTPGLMLIDSLRSPLCLTAAVWFQYRLASSLIFCLSVLKYGSNSISGVRLQYQIPCCNQFKQAYSSFCFSIERSSNWRSTNTVFIVHRLLLLYALRDLWKEWGDSLWAIF